jgi:hypothetical protein
MRNRVGFPFWEAAAGLVGAGMVVSGVFVAAGGRGPEFDRGEEALGGTIFALFGLVCVVWAYSQHRRRRPLDLRGRLRGVMLAVDRHEPRRGEELAVTLTARGGAARRDGLELGLVCTERYDSMVRAQHRAGTTLIRQTREATPHQQWQPVETAGGERTLTFEIPRDGPYSYEGECVSYAWRVSARVVRRLRSDLRLDHPIWVRP